jgi:hypothetical protein
MTFQSLLCRLGLHRWNRPYKHRAGGFVSTRRRCPACKVIQERQLPDGGWKAVKRKRRRHLHPLTTTEESVLDRRKGLEPI